MKTKILKIKGDWQEVVNDCRATVGKEAIGKEPSHEWKKKILISEHSPIRDIVVKLKWSGIPYWVAMHWKTHKWESRTISQRNDRQEKYDRNKAPQDTPVDFIGEPNVQHLIDTMRKRLCFQASPETREYAEDLKLAIHEVQPEIADVLIPNCVYRAGCPELLQQGKKCVFYETMCNKHPDFASTDLQKRYDAYNQCFYSRYAKGRQDTKGEETDEPKEACKV